MNTVQQIYFAKLQQVQAGLDARAAQAGMRAPLFSGVLSGLLAADEAPEAKSGEYGAYIAQAAAENSLDASLIRAVIQAESGGRADAVSAAGAEGLMQLMPGTAASLGVTDSFDPAQNIAGGTKYLKGLLDRFGDIRLALAAYNTGPGRISDLNITDADDAAQYERISQRVRNYVDRVLGSDRAYAGEGESAV